LARGGIEPPLSFGPILGTAPSGERVCAASREEGRICGAHIIKRELLGEPPGGNKIPRGKRGQTIVNDDKTSENPLGGATTTTRLVEGAAP